MSTTIDLLHHPVARLAAGVTTALTWAMALLLCLAPQFANGEETTSAPPAASPPPSSRTSNPLLTDRPLSHPYYERFSSRYFGPYC